MTKIAIKNSFCKPAVSFKEISERPDLPFFYAALKSRGSCAGWARRMDVLCVGTF